MVADDTLTEVWVSTFKQCMIVVNGYAAMNP